MEHRLATCLVLGLLGAAALFPARAADPAPADGLAAISQEDLLKRVESRDPELVVLDVRTPAEFAAGHVPGAINISHDQLASRLDELSSARARQVVLYCRSGRRSMLAADTLRQAGFTKLLHLQGDYLAWEAAKRPVELPETPAEAR